MNEKPVPDYVGLLKALLVTKTLVDATGKVLLTDEEAARIRALGFPTAEAGRWQVPPVPPELVRDNRLFENLAIGWPAHLTWTPANPRTGEGAALVDECVRSAERFQPRPARPVPADVWLSQFGTVDHLRVLAALVRESGGVIRKRDLQQLLHRIPAVRLNRALNSLIAAGILVREGAYVTLPAHVRSVLLRPGVLVNQRLVPRALAPQRDEGRLRSARHPTHARELPGGDSGWSQYSRIAVRRRRPLPRVGTSAWGRSMLAKRGGYARQQQCRVRGINPMAKATFVRLSRQRRRKQNEPQGRSNPTTDRRRPPDQIIQWSDAQRREQREADAAWSDKLLDHLERLHRRGGR